MMDVIAQYFSDFTWVKSIDMAGLVLGLIYLWLEFKASIWLWLVSIIMPIVHGYLYWARGLYADFGMEVYYVLAAVYGYAMWRWARRRTNVETQNLASPEEKELPITHFPLRRLLPVALIGLALWGIIYWVLITFTDSRLLNISFTSVRTIVQRNSTLLG